MAEKTGISWCHHTFNPWWGCVEVSPACDHCYAKREATRFGFDVWGSGAARRIFGNDHWLEPIRWNAHAAKDGVRRRVFCGSMCDVLEGRPDLDDERHHLAYIIEETKHLDWMLLTKRPQFAGSFPWTCSWPANAWLGVTVESNAYRWRIDQLLRVDGPLIRFISAEPLLGALDLDENAYLWPQCISTKEEHDRDHDGGLWCVERCIDLVVAGGESGPKARPSNPADFRRLRDQCVKPHIPFHFKQWGEWAPGENVEDLRRYRTKVLFGDVWRDCSDDWATEKDDGPIMYRIGKKRAGHLLDGREWREMPEVRT